MTRADTRATLPAQTMAERIAQKAREAAEKAAQKAEGKVDAAIDKGLDKLDECLFTDAACIKKAQTGGKKVTLKDGDGNVVDAKGKPLPAPADPEAADAATAKQDSPPVVWANFDFAEAPAEK